MPFESPRRSWRSYQENTQRLIYYFCFHQSINNYYNTDIQIINILHSINLSRSKGSWDTRRLFLFDIDCGCDMS